MLLRRFLTHFRAQDWLAIALDFVIVVVGIFVGLQVDSWNQDRKERIRERAGLEQLYTDFESARDRARTMADFHAEKAEDLGFVIDTMLSESLADGDRRRFLRALIGMLQMPPLGINLGAYESMVASGDIALIRDDELKSMLVGLDAVLESEASLLNYFRIRNQQDMGFIDRHFRLVPNSDRSDIALSYELDTLLNDPLAYSVIANQQRNHRVFQDLRQEIADELDDARNHIGDLIGAGGPAAE